MLVAPLNVVELYSGTARSAEPFRRWKRCKISLLVDNNEHAKATYLANYPDAPYVKASARTVRVRRVTPGTATSTVLERSPKCFVRSPSRWRTCRPRQRPSSSQ